MSDSRKRPAPRLTVAASALLASAAVCTSATTAHAGGFEIPDYGARSVGRGGASVVGGKDLTAIHHNPALLAKLRGTHVYYSQNVVFHDTTFQRNDFAANSFGNNPELTYGPVSDRSKVFPIAGLFMAASSDFGLKNWTFALSGYGPSSVGRHDYPSYGPQSFMLTQLNVLVLFINASAAWKYKDIFGVGVTAQYAMLPQMLYGLTVDSAVNPANNFDDYALSPEPPASGQLMVNTMLSLRDNTSGTGILGMWVRPIRALEIGAAARIVPVYFNAQSTKGCVKNPFRNSDFPSCLDGVNLDSAAGLSAESAQASLKFAMPWQLRGGIRYIHERKEREVFDVELDYHYEAWQVIKNYDIDFSPDSTINGQLMSDLRIPKNWKGTHSIRLGSDVNLLDDHLSIRMGGFFETSTVEQGYAHLDFPGFMRGGPSVGLTGTIRGISLTAGYMHLFQQRQDITNADARNYQVRPLWPCPDNCTIPNNGTDVPFNGVPANNGVFKSKYDILSLSLQIDFNTLVKSSKRYKAKHPEGSGGASPGDSSGATPALPPAKPLPPKEDEAGAQPSESGSTTEDESGASEGSELEGAQDSSEGEGAKPAAGPGGPGQGASL